jgi:hypothetical protein
MHRRWRSDRDKFYGGNHEYRTDCALDFTPRALLDLDDYQPKDIDISRATAVMVASLLRMFARATSRHGEQR